ncbi:MAG: phytoene desaturase family protein [Pyrobaculum sp.]
MKIAIVGAGFGGLAAAALLAKRGHEVVVFDKRCAVGGRSMAVEVGGFKAEIGPTWYLMPELYEAFFSELGTSPPYRLVELKPKFLYIDKGVWVEVGEDLGARLEELERGAGDKFVELMERAAVVYDRVIRWALYRSYDSPLDVAAAALSLRSFSLLQPYEKLLSRYFKNPLVKRLLAYDGMFLGTPPWELPAVYGLLVTYATFVRGVYHPVGGFGAVASGVASLVEKLGGQFRLCTEVKEVVVEGGRAAGVATSAGVEKFDAVVVNADYLEAERRLLRPEYRTLSDGWDLAPSAYMAVVAFRGKAPAVHTIYIDSWERHMEALFSNGAMPESPSFYVHIPTLVEENWGRGGWHTAFVLVPAPPGGGYGPEGLGAALVERVVDGEVVPLAEFSTDFFCGALSSYKCTALGLRHNLKQTAWGRPPIRHRKVKNLYFVGQYVHPGVGVPMVLTSAVILEKRYF